MDWRPYTRYSIWHSCPRCEKYRGSESCSCHVDLWTSSRDLPSTQNNRLINKSLAPSATLYLACRWSYWIGFPCKWSTRDAVKGLWGGRSNFTECTVLQSELVNALTATCSTTHGNFSLESLVRSVNWRVSFVFPGMVRTPVNLSRAVVWFHSQR